ncbi:hypothetical protein EGI16_06825 [Chryseobacterium sp. G0240]|uniref:DUF5977 domain-containing protein n=1 Tax=Chryseobacterium sp. G0240 TaxID=2487066 RepID=UPI000F457C93|nr:DUF5977 domain-containing protein [Chryseobacterium sp. G0240]ROI05032.1 hypothetical protein EGI16_06825 [Chryseobacterium sp. G0240]
MKNIHSRIKPALKAAVLAFLFAKTITVNAQQDLKLYTPLFPNSPSAKSFGHHGLYPVNLFKGTPNISIPIFQSKIGGSDFDISLTYDVTMVKPEAVHSSTGLGWSLNAGGAITRIVNGQYDELYTSTLNDNSALSYLDHYSGLDRTDWADQSLMSSYHSSIMSVGAIFGGMRFGGLNMDTYTDKLLLVPDPDEFIINIMGITGKFYMNEKGKWIGRTRDGRTFTVQHIYKDNYNLKSNDSISQILRRILYGFNITMDDGTQYIFGQNDTTVEFSQDRHMCDCANKEHIVPSSWQISEVKFPNGKKINFTYERAPKPNYVASNVSFTNITKTSNGYEQVAANGTTVANIMHNTYLKTIDSDDFTIEINKSAVTVPDYIQNIFNFNTRSFISIYLAPDSGLPYNTWYKIDNILVKDKNNHTVNTTSLYYNSTDSSTRLHLGTVINNGKEKYSFAYNGKKLPAYLDWKYDNWGYYSPSLSNGPDLEYSKAETLEQITYPTGGKTTFTYELNDHSRYGNKNVSNTSTSGLEFLNTTNPKEIAGGLRIKQIQACSEGSSNCITKNYSYIGDDGKSSGFLPYQFIKKRGGEVPGQFIWSQETTNSFQTLKNENNLVGYSKVTETDSNGGKTETYFTNFDTPDCNDRRGVFTFGSPDEFSGLYKSIPFTSFSLMRGKPLKEIISSDSGVVQTKEYQYDYQSNFIKAYGVSDVLIENVTYFAMETAYYINFNTSFLKGIKTTYNNVVTNETNEYEYVYNTLKSKKITDGNGDNIITNYIYAHNKPNSFLTGKYMVGIPLKSEVLKNGKTFAKSETLYPVSQSEADTKTSGLPLPTASISYDLQDNTSITEATYDKYDNQGNLVQYTLKNGISSAIVWGYNNKLPIAKVDGAKIIDIPQSAIDNIVNASNNDAQQATEASEQSLMDALDAFKNNPELAGFMMTTFTYDPLIGVKSIMQPSGIREFYKYNAANELIRIEDQNKNILKEFSYNYNLIKYYNTANSQTFTKNNCSSLQYGGTYTYTVPANKYESLLSQADADQKAQEELNTNGQSTANANAQCYNAQCYATAVNGIEIGPHAEISQNVLGHFKVDIQVKVPNSLTNPDGSQWWQKGVANIPNPCRPDTNLAPNIFNNNVKELTTNTWWKVQVTSSGDLIFIPDGYVAPGTQLYFVFEYDKTP